MSVAKGKNNQITSHSLDVIQSQVEQVCPMLSLLVPGSPNVMEIMQSKMQEEVEALQALQKQSTKALTARQTLDSQLNENQLVKEEMDKLEAGANVHKKCDGSAPLHVAISMGAIPAHAEFAEHCVNLVWLLIDPDI